MKKFSYINIAPIFFLVGLPIPAYAYLDPGTGSIILQGIIAGLASVSFAVKIYWHKLKSLFQKNDKLNDEEGNEEVSEN